MKFRPVDLTKVKTISVGSRKSKVNTDFFASPCKPDCSISEFLNNLPGILKSPDFLYVTDGIIRAYKKKKPVILGMGAHVIKCGLSPVIIDLMETGFITAIAMNGAGAIHDFEVANIGTTSEDVAAGLADGSFGMADETGRGINEAVKKSGAEKGFGRSVGESINESEAPFRDCSLLASAARLDIPATIHVAVGTDIIHQHPSADGAAIGEASYYDFKLLTDVVSNLNDGGVYLNFGSAVILPEVFLKALTIARNINDNVKDFITANFDMIGHYRPNVNIVSRPVLEGGRGFDFRGHHEIMLPLLASAVKTRLNEVKSE